MPKWLLSLHSWLPLASVFYGLGNPFSGGIRIFHYIISSSSDKFTEQLDFTPKEIDIKDKATEGAKFRGKCKNTCTKSIKITSGNKNLTKN